MTTRMFRPDDPEERWLLPPSPRDWLPENHLAYFLSDLVEAECGAARCRIIPSCW